MLKVNKELTSGVSFPPTMLRPRPDRPLEISIVISWPGTIGHVAGSSSTKGGGKLPTKTKLIDKSKQKHYTKNDDYVSTSHHLEQQRKIG